jgi:hypothetical protein
MERTDRQQYAFKIKNFKINKFLLLNDYCFEKSAIESKSHRYKNSERFDLYLGKLLSSNSLMLTKITRLFHDTIF